MIDTAGMELCSLTTAAATTAAVVAAAVVAVGVCMNMCPFFCLAPHTVKRNAAYVVQLN